MGESKRDFEAPAGRPPPGRVRPGPAWNPPNRRRRPRNTPPEEFGVEARADFWFRGAFLFFGARSCKRTFPKIRPEKEIFGGKQKKPSIGKAKSKHR